MLKKILADCINDELPLQHLDGILMANALHFVKHKNVFIQKLRFYIKGKASLLVVEYDTAQANAWVPYPLTIEGWQQLFRECGFSNCREINRHASVYGRADIVGMVMSS